MLESEVCPLKYKAPAQFLSPPRSLNSRPKYKVWGFIFLGGGVYYGPSRLLFFVLFNRDLLSDLYEKRRVDSLNSIQVSDYSSGWDFGVVLVFRLD